MTGAGDHSGAHPRRPRFHRQSPPALRLTADDLEIIRHVGRFRFLRSSHIAQLLPERSPKKIIGRLHALYHAGYLDRPRAQINYFAQSGSAPIVYALGNEGAEILAETGAKPAPIVDWTDKNRTAKRPYIEHALMLADLMVGVERVTGQHKEAKLLSEEKLLELAPPETRKARNPWALTGAFSEKGKRHSVTVAPDWVFALEFPQSGKRSNFFVEIDRATMPVSRSDPNQTSFKKKLQTYLAAHRAKQHVDRLGFRNLRILTVTTSAERIKSMLAAVDEITASKGSGMFLFASREMFYQNADPLTSPWITSRGPVLIDIRGVAPSPPAKTRLRPPDADATEA